MIKHYQRKNSDNDAADIVSTSFIDQNQMTENTETLLVVLINNDENKMKIISKPGVTLLNGDVL